MMQTNNKKINPYSFWALICTILIPLTTIYWFLQPVKYVLPIIAIILAFKGIQESKTISSSKDNKKIIKQKTAYWMAIAAIIFSVLAIGYNIFSILYVAKMQAQLSMITG